MPYTAGVIEDINKKHLVLLQDGRTLWEALTSLDVEKESDTPFQQVSIEEIPGEQKVDQQTTLETENLKVQALKDQGFSIPPADTLNEY